MSVVNGAIPVLCFMQLPLLPFYFDCGSISTSLGVEPPPHMKEVAEAPRQAHGLSFRGLFAFFEKQAK